MLEGSIGIGQDPYIVLNEQTMTDTIYRAESYQYCNVFCMYRLAFELKNILEGMNDIEYHDHEPQMDSFGDFAVLIKDEKEFLRRVGKAAERKGCSFLCGDVHCWRPRNAKTFSIIIRRKDFILVQKHEKRYPSFPTQE